MDGMTIDKPKRRRGKVKELKLDLGCGANKRDGFHGVDLVKLKGVDTQCDLFRMPWPWRSGSVDELHCSHFIEHVPDLIGFMDECWRVLKPGGQMTVIAPYYTSIRCWQDPTHRNAISEATFLYFNQGWLKGNGLEHYGIKADFDFTYGYALDPDIANRNDEARAFAIKHYWNAVQDIQVTLTKRGD